MNAADLTSKREPLPSSVIDLDARLFDASRFPLVRLRRRAVQPGYAFAWCAQMRRLLALTMPFVIVTEHDDSETADDTRIRTAWLRAQRTQLAAYCRGIVVIEPRIEARATTREALRRATEGSGVRTVVVSSLRVAGELAPVLLKHSGEPAAPVSRSRAV
ncbi:hypothetical protein [Caballeronia insecticola]|uniref:Uncharacterized protein n=1 Tax=Caballeronia insecticola TaxID=758793 RepID=R4WHM2_9BURK|nr:hypothetical protein [Caballeronia insecticola]BAN23624.1 uncharacterized protein BRPE64_ACDS18700 [Caballeronia insecticola]